MIFRMRLWACAAACVAFAGLAFGHGDVVPQPVDVKGLNPTGTEWLKENPYRADPVQKKLATEIGASGYNQNCARCHGLEGISGGLAPDLRYLEEGKFGDEWYMERIRAGYTQNGVTKMPKFEGIFSQEAMWAIRTYIESRPQD
jgi:cytochrome c-550 PedF